MWQLMMILWLGITLRCISYMDYHFTFLFEDLFLCNLNIIREFYVNMKIEVHSLVLTVWGIEVNITPEAINGILSTMDLPLASFIYLKMHPPYRAIRHSLARVYSTTKWILHTYKRYYQSFPFEHMDRDIQVWVKIVTHSFFPG